MSNSDRPRPGRFDRALVGVVLTLAAQFALQHMQLTHQDRSHVRDVRRDAYVELFRTIDRDTSNFVSVTRALADQNLEQARAFRPRLQTDSDAFNDAVAKVMIVGDSEDVRLTPLLTAAVNHRQALLDWSADPANDALTATVERTGRSLVRAEAEFAVVNRG